MEYIIIFVILSFTSFLEINGLIRGKAFFMLLVLVLILFAGTRYSIGIDYNTYLASYEQLNTGQGIRITEIEGLFIILSKSCSDFHALLLVYAILGVGLKGYFFSKTPYPYTCLMLYYSFCFLWYDMGIMRQGAALALCLCSIKYIEKRKLLVFLVLVLCSTLFIHRSSILFSFAYLLNDLDFKRRTFYLILAASVCAGFLIRESTLYFITSLLPSYFLKFNNIIGGYGEEISGWSFSTFRKIAFAVMFYEYMRRKKLYYGWNKLAVNIYTIGVCASVALIINPNIAGRGTYYYCIMELVLFATCLKSMKSRIHKNFAYILLVVYNLLYLNTVLDNDYTFSWMNLNYLPYKTILK